MADIDEWAKPRETEEKASPTFDEVFSTKERGGTPTPEDEGRRAIDEEVARTNQLVIPAKITTDQFSLGLMRDGTPPAPDPEMDGRYPKNYDWRNPTGLPPSEKFIPQPISPWRPTPDGLIRPSNIPGGQMLDDASGDSRMTNAFIRFYERHKDFFDGKAVSCDYSIGLDPTYSGDQSKPSDKPTDKPTDKPPDKEKPRDKPTSDKPRPVTSSPFPRQEEGQPKPLTASPGEVRATERVKPSEQPPPARVRRR